MIDRSFVDYWSERYDKNALKRDKKLEKRIRGKLKKLFPDGKVKYILKDTLFDIVNWKAPRKKKLAKDNKKEYVFELTKANFKGHREQLKIEGLTLLKGVEYRVASAILHFCFPKKYTVMDYRTWECLQKEKELPKDCNIKDDFEHWQKYLKICRKIAKRCNVPLRKLDKALWQYHKELECKKKLRK
ncbi:MAG: hypothetical protein JSV30_05920 [Candidatus Omnitrophota bacterium]|nr:MAG: hypothetical protein JSV30_05920 [Candidatus Omnitrophota bacterium]